MRSSRGPYLDQHSSSQLSYQNHFNANMSAFPTLVAPILTQLSADHTNSLMGANASSAVLAAAASAAANQASNNGQEQFNSLQMQYQSLSRRYQNKEADNEKLAKKYRNQEAELQNYRQLLGQISTALDRGQNVNFDAFRNAVANANALARSSGSSSGSSSSLGSSGVSRPAKIGRPAGSLTKAVKSSGVCTGSSHRNSKNNCSCDTYRPFQCEYPDCGKRFTQKHHLNLHRHIHTGQRYICEWPNCGKSFVRKYNLQEHVKMHSDEGHNRCKFFGCGMVFSSRYSLMRHQTAQHEVKMR